MFSPSTTCNPVIRFNRTTHLKIKLVIFCVDSRVQTFESSSRSESLLAFLFFISFSQLFLSFSELFLVFPEFVLSVSQFFFVFHCFSQFFFVSLVFSQFFLVFSQFVSAFRSFSWCCLVFLFFLVFLSLSQSFLVFLVFPSWSQFFLFFFVFRRRLGGESAAAPTGKSFRFVRASERAGARARSNRFGLPR